MVRRTNAKRGMATGRKRRPEGEPSRPKGFGLTERAIARLALLAAARGWSESLMVEHLIMTAELQEQGTPDALASEVRAMVAAATPEQVAWVLALAKKRVLESGELDETVMGPTREAFEGCGALTRT